jgi:UDP-N-acetylmuramoylalanine--D-glutamate ligase
MNLENKHTLVVGLGITGAAVAQFLKKNGAFVTITDISSEADLGPIVASLREFDIRMELGRHRTETFESADLIVLSPGVPDSITPVKSAKQKKIPILGEVELAYRFIQEPIVAVTGTNGKTTTTVLLGEMLKKSGYKVFVGGNIGTPLIGYLNQDEKVDIIVAEVSSFQLDTIEAFRPKVGVLLNLTADHLDRYPDFSAYARAKGSIFINQQSSDIAVLNGSDPHVRSFSNNIKSKKLIFYNQDGAWLKPDHGALINKAKIVFHSTEVNQWSLEVSAVKIMGKHNLENVTAASLAARAVGATFEGIKSAIKEFKGLPHRLEHIATKNNVRYFNDSKATNLDAVARALEAFSQPVVLIMGGRDKGGKFGALKDLIRRHVKQLTVMGEARDKLKSAFGHLVPIKTATTMKDAVFQASKAASPGDVVLLSPGCASFDMYNNYAERGEDFSEIVKSL